MSKALIVGTGPSLQDQLDLLTRFDGLVFTCNNTYLDVKTNVWIACDPAWHEIYSPVDFKKHGFDAWHWSKTICDNYGYKYIEGVWHDGLWLEDKTKISLNHCSGAQLLNLACHYDCEPIILVGHDFDYPAGRPRHYFKGLSDTDGEYPERLRKHSKFAKNDGTDDLLAVYKRIADTPGRPEIINCTPGSKLPWFPMGDLQDYLN